MLKLFIENFVTLFTDWSFDLVVLAILFRKPLTTFLSELGTLIINKDGFEMRKITKEAKDTLSDFKELASTVFVPILGLTTKAGRLSAVPSIKERLEISKQMKNFISKQNIKNEELENKLLGLNNSILFDTLYSIVNKNIELYNKTRELINTNDEPSNYFKCTADLPKLKKVLEENDYLNPEVEYVLEEATYFFKNKEFKNFNKLRPILNNLHHGIA